MKYPPQRGYEHVFINTTIIDVIIGIQAGQYWTQEWRGWVEKPIILVRTCRVYVARAYTIRTQNEFSRLSEFLMCPIIDRLPQKFTRLLRQICTGNVNIDNWNIFLYVYACMCSSRQWKSPSVCHAYVCSSLQWIPTCLYWYYDMRLWWRHQSWWWANINAHTPAPVDHEMVHVCLV